MRRLRAGLRGVLLGTTLLAFWLLALGNLVSFRMLLKQRVSFPSRRSNAQDHVSFPSRRYGAF